MSDNNISFGVLIVTINNNIERVKTQLLPQLGNIDEIVIAHQIFDNNTEPSTFSDPRIIYLPTKQRGVSNNRNIAMAHTNSDIVHICGDDISYVKGFKDTILSAYKDFPDLGIISFQAQDPDTGKNIIHVQEGKHNLRSILSTKSCGMTYNKRVLKDMDLIFDERFGLGAHHPTGEETIYFSDFLKKGGKAIHINSPIVYHSADTSGSDFSNLKLIGSRIQVFRRMFGFIGAIFAAIFFGLRDYKRYRKNISFYKYVSLHIENIFQKNY